MSFTTYQKQPNKQTPLKKGAKIRSNCEEMDPKGVIAKSSEVRNLFSLGDSECVVQDYHCQQGWSPLGGRLFICLWTLCWRASVGDTQWSVRLEQVEDCVASKSALILDRA